MKKNYAVNVLKVLFCYSLLLAQNIKAQAPTISYTGPQTYYVSSAVTPLNPSYSGTTATPPNGQTITLAGSGSAGFANGSGTAASFNQPLGTAVDALGNVYISDAINNVIRKITPAGVVTTFAGSGAAGFANGTGTAAMFNHPVGLAFDLAGNLYVADEDNQMIREISPAGVVTTLAGSGATGSANGAAASASFNLPCGVAVDFNGRVYVADYNNNQIREIGGGTVWVFAGSATGVSGSANGTATAASFNHPFSVTCDYAGTVYVADRLNNMIREITPAAQVTTLAGNTTAGSANGTGTAASFNIPTTVTVDGLLNVYVADEFNNKIRRITPAGVVTTLSGSGGTGATNSIGPASTFNDPFAVAVDASGYVYVGDYGNNLIRKVATTAYGILPALPPGLIFNTTTGVITGTPTATSPSTNYTITAYNSIGSGTATLNITVQPANVAPSLTAGNTVRTDIIKVGGVTNQAQIQTGVNAETEISYMDGLGRPVQRIEQAASPLQKDIVQIMVYDQYGRTPTQYLPYTAATSNGSLQTNAVAAQNAFYQVANQQIAVDNAPYAGTVYDNTPIQRVLEQAAPGATWQTAGSLATTWQAGGAHDVKTQFRLNAASDNIRIWNSSGPTSTYYAASYLSVNTITDENGNQVLTFTNQLGQMVEKKVQASATIWLETVFVYDDIGHLLYQISPQGVKLIYGASPPAFNAAFTNTWATTYTYDAKGRLVTKQAPGAAAVYMIYDSYNRLVLMQDGRLRNAYSTDTWYATKYDITNRVVITGLYTYAAPVPAVGATNQQILQNYLDGLVYNNTTVFSYEARATGTGYYGYTNQSFPLISFGNVLSVNYYDDYNYYNTTVGTKYFFNGTTAVLYQNPNQTNFATTSATDTHGFLTGTMARIITPAGNNGGWINQAIFYDQYGNAIQKQTNNYVNPAALDVTSNLVDIYGGHVIQTKQVKSLSATTVLNTIAYDLMGRVLNVSININGAAAQVVSKYDYNELGQLKDKGLGLITTGVNSGTYLQTVDYRYNIRGWLTSINNSTLANDGGLTNSNSGDIWGETILYEKADATGLSNTPKYNGKISEIKWQANDQFSTSTNPVRQRSYTYTYDSDDRLTGAQYAAYGTTAWNQETGGYNESVGSYDNNGNIMSLTRNTFASGGSTPTAMDALTYHYMNSNASDQLAYISDAGTAAGYNGAVASTNQYSYDGDGNLTGDADKAQIITYNDLNKVSKVAVTGAGSIQYSYDASGTRIRKVVYNAASAVIATYDYLDGFVYTTPGGGTIALTYFSTAEGRVLSNTTATAFTYEYFINDHLGNTRVSFHDNGSGVAAMTQENEYYPFGMTMTGIIQRTAQPNPGNKQLFNGDSELQDDLGYENSYSTPIREYDPQIGRFNAIDPMVDKYASSTPYNFAFNDPVGGNDPGGADGDPFGGQPSTSLSPYAPQGGTTGGNNANPYGQGGYAENVWAYTSVEAMVTAAQNSGAGYTYYYNNGMQTGRQMDVNYFDNGDNDSGMGTSSDQGAKQPATVVTSLPQGQESPVETVIAIRGYQDMYRTNSESTPDLDDDSNGGTVDMSNVPSWGADLTQSYDGSCVFMNMEVVGDILGLPITEDGLITCYAFDHQKTRADVQQNGIPSAGFTDYVNTNNEISAFFKVTPISQDDISTSINHGNPVMAIIFGGVDVQTGGVSLHEITIYSYSIGANGTTYNYIDTSNGTSQSSSGVNFADIIAISKK